MSVTMLSCEDESDPFHCEQSRCLVSPREGGKDVFPLLPNSLVTLLRKVRVKASAKSKTRLGRGSLRSLISLQILRDDRCFMHRLALLCRTASPLLEYYPLSNRFLSDDEAFGVIAHARVQTQTQSSLVRRTSLFTSPVVIIDKQVSQRPLISTGEAASNSSFCIPAILITPPTPGDEASPPGCNIIPLPQISADGFYLTIPDFDAYDTYATYDWRRYGERCAANIGRQMEAEDQATQNQGCAGMESCITKLVRGNTYFNFNEDIDETIDLGPTWSG